MNKHIFSNFTIFILNICIFSQTQTISHDMNDHAFPKTITFLNNTGETIKISLPNQQEIAPGESFLLSDDNHQKKPKIRWHIPKDTNSGIHIHSALFSLEGNILDIIEIYDENPQGSKSVFKTFKKVVTLSSTSSSFELFKNARIVDIKEKNQ